jgi:hypothetical protein
MFSLSPDASTESKVQEGKSFAVRMVLFEVKGFDAIAVKRYNEIIAK